MENPAHKHHTEAVYDDEMFPLVAQLIEIATREGIPLLVSAGMIVDVDGEYVCARDPDDAEDPLVHSAVVSVAAFVGPALIVANHYDIDTPKTLLSVIGSSR